MIGTSPEDTAHVLNERIVDGWAAAMGVRFVRASGDEVVAELDIKPHHRQPYGIVHGGVHAGIIETLASVGAALVAMPRGQSVVGLENNTSFIRAVREGKLRCIAKPLTRGRTTQVWEGEVRDEDDKLIATGRVRLICLDPNADLAGAKATVPDRPSNEGS
jgi:uncharacterized protein (TIGR00369 family)